MIVEPAVAGDVPEIVALEEAFDTPWSEESWRAELDGDDRLVLAARRRSDGVLIGAASFRVVDDVAELNRIVVAPQQRRLGLARVMLVAGMQWAIGKGAARMLLEVDHANDAAIALYRGYGFRQIAVRPDYYGPGADALILERGLEGVDADSVGMWDMEGADE